MDLLQGGQQRLSLRSSSLDVGAGVLDACAVWRGGWFWRGGVTMASVGSFEEHTRL